MFFKTAACLRWTDGAHLEVRLGAAAVAEGAVRAQSVALGTWSKGESKNNSFMRGWYKRLELSLM